MDNVRFPFGPAELLSVTSAATVNLQLNNGGLTIVKLSALGAACTLNIASATTMYDGARLLVEIPCGATAYNLTLGTGFVGAAVEGVINKTKWAEFVYVSGAFVQISVNQIN